MANKSGNGKRGLSHEGLSGAAVLDITAGMSLDNYSREEHAAFIELVNSYLVRIAAGDMPPKIDTSYGGGQFESIKDSINAVIDVVHARNKDVEMMIQASVDGRLGVRIDCTRYS